MDLLLVLVTCVLLCCFLLFSTLASDAHMSPLSLYPLAPPCIFVATLRRWLHQSIPTVPLGFITNPFRIPILMLSLSTLHSHPPNPFLPATFHHLSQASPIQSFHSFSTNMKLHACVHGSHAKVTRPHPLQPVQLSLQAFPAANCTHFHQRRRHRPRCRQGPW